MKNIFLSLIVLICFASCAITQKGNCKGNAKLFKQHFKILDSIASVTPIDTLLNCQPSIQFMEKTTGIESSTDADFFGKFFGCTKSDLANWHKWYEENCLKKKKSK